MLSLSLAFAFVVAAPDSTAKPETQPGTPPGAEPRSVPEAAAPSSGAPRPLQQEWGDDEYGDAYEHPFYDPLRALEPHTPKPATRRRPTSVFTKARKSAGARPGKKPRRKRDPNHHMLPLPHISAQPATGLTLGGSLNYSYRRPGEEFNRAYVLAWSRVSTLGVHDHIVSGRFRNMLGRNEVIQFGVWISVDPVFPFHGINNHENLAGTELEGPYNYFSMDNYGGWFTYEHPLWELHRPNRPLGTLRQYTGLFYYIDVARGSPTSRLVQQNPELVRTDRRGIVRTGLTWDSRDNDWNPHEGSLVDVTIDLAGPYTGSTSSWGRVHGTARNFWPLGTTGFVFAHRVTFDALWGKPPLMALGELGGLFPMDAYGGAFVGRGFFRRRFLGNIKATATAEMRFTPLEFDIGRSKLGVGFEGFFELGLVAMKMEDLFKHWHPSGGPGLLLIWNRFVVFRVEAGFSREGGALYLQSEYAF
ncbi:MAG: BamA/TamA family outer membrane protein [Nannocystis sp.]|nr:BamA/TamA family outer membrane protein [Nannocystis sp.]MBA3545091.1 BamA/TamA family outer membrane protein [Nannocystis sp.]